MKRLWKRSTRLAVMTLGFAGLIVAVNAVPGTAISPSGFTATPLARGTYMSDGTLPIKQGLDIVVVLNTVDSHGSSGWHSHPGGAIVVVQSGEITTYQSVGNHCVITIHKAHEAFIERPGQPLIAVNNTLSQTIIYATFPSVPVGGSTKTDLPDPGTCDVPKY